MMVRLSRLRWYVAVVPAGRRAHSGEGRACLRGLSSGGDPVAQARRELRAGTCSDRMPAVLRA